MTKSNILIIDAHHRDSFALGLYRSGQGMQVSEFPQRAQDLQREIEGFLTQNKFTLGELTDLAFVTEGESLTGIRIAAVAVNTLAWLLRLPIIPLDQPLTHKTEAILDKSSDLARVAQLANID